MNAEKQTKAKHDLQFKLQNFLPFSPSIHVVL